METCFIHPKMKSPSSFIHVVQNLYNFVFLDTKADILEELNNIRAHRLHEEEKKSCFYIKEVWKELIMTEFMVFKKF